ncbi:MAG: hypothetical protein H6563_06065 [Lewinellaceae bacterium]|nr:hypothetical protein [Lewinellaceae bacterium]
MRLRLLSRMEQAWTITDRTYPLTAVCILRLENGPSPVVLESEWQKIQAIHPALRIAIRQDGNDFRFEEQVPPPPIRVETPGRNGDSQWETVARQLLNSSIDHSRAPLIRCVYLFDPEVAHSELILAAHHAIVDAASITQLFHQLLNGVAGNEKKSPRKPYPFPPGSDSLFPKKFKGLSLAYRLAGFFSRQFKEEWRYRKAMKGLPPTTIPSSSENGTGYLTLDEALSTALIREARKRGVSLPGLLSAALLLSVWEKKYDRIESPHRAVIFADLRPHLDPPVAPEVLGCYLSMLRFTTQLDQSSTLWTLAHQLSRSVYHAGKRGERFLYAYLSKALVQMTLRLRNQRLGTTALSFAGPLSLEPQYGKVRIRDIHGYITSNPLGPVFSAFGKLFNGRIGLDIQYLTGELSPEEARSISGLVLELLTQAAKTDAV